MFKEKIESASEDLRNIKNVQRIFEEGSDDELEKLRKFYNLTKAQVESFRYYAMLRKEVHQEMQNELEKRVGVSPDATAEEMNAGVYQENLEPQVRDAVKMLRQKGYCTYESGFYGENTQRISFEEDLIKDFEPSEELIQELKEKNIEIKIEPASITFICGKKIGIDDLKDIWDQVVGELPDLKRKAKQCSLESAKDFRKKYKSSIKK
jgi:hypothetical protein